MSVQFEHPQYKAFIDKWKRCRDVSNGQDAVHEAGTDYLPRLKDQSDDDYKAYRTRANFYNATWRTIAGLIGMIFRKPPKIVAPAATEVLLPTVTQDGQTFGVFAREIVEECIAIGRVGVLVDYPEADTTAVTQADAALLNLRPTLSLYQAENIINWKQEVISNQRILTMVVLVEDEEVVKDEFESSLEKRYRVLDLVLTDAGTYRYRVRIFKIDSVTKQEVQLGDDVFPVIRGAAVTSIPFYFLSSDSTCVEPDDPPLIDLVDLNLSHYRTTADYEHGCHFTGLPTGYVTGYTKEANQKLYIGSQSMLIFPEPTAKVGFLEFTGQGLDALKANLDRKEAQMAVLGARMLEQQKRAVESAEAASIHRAGENSMLADAAQAISLGLTAALQMFSDWAGSTGEVTVELNRDFFPAPMNPQQLDSLVAAWQKGAISKQALFDNLQAGQIVAEGTTFEKEEVRINDQLIPAASGLPATPPEDDEDA